MDKTGRYAGLVPDFKPTEAPKPDGGRKSASCDGSPATAGKSIRSAITMLEDALVTCEMHQPGAAKVLINVARSYLNGAEELLFKSR